MFKKATKLSTMVIVAGTVMEISVPLALAEEAVKSRRYRRNDQYGESERRQSG